jgi:hypothetical protein
VVDLDGELTEVDATAPVYPLVGSLKHYWCSPVGVGYPAGRNCTVSPMPQAACLARQLTSQFNDRTDRGLNKELRGLDAYKDNAQTVCTPWLPSSRHCLRLFATVCACGSCRGNGTRASTQLGCIAGRSCRRGRIPTLWPRT